MLGSVCYSLTNIINQQSAVDQFTLNYHQFTTKGV